MNLSPSLKLLGLNRSEITVYLDLLENGLSTPPNVSRRTFIARTNCYNILLTLKDKGLIEEQAQGKRKAYVACDPESLLRSLDKKKEAIQQILPDLRGLFSTQKNKPKIKFYDGLDQVKEVYLQSLSAKKIMAIGSTNQINTLMPEFLDNYFAEVRMRGIFFYNILSRDSENTANKIKGSLLSYYEPKFLSEKYRDPPIDILIWDSNVALITLKESIFATILNNTLIAETFKLLFEIIAEMI